MSSRRDLALALDFESREELFAAIERLGSARPVLKLGLRLLPWMTPSDFSDLKKRGFKIFVDAKLHDIPTQVSSALRTWQTLGADFVTIHTSGGRAMVRAAMDAVRGGTTRVLGVSVLTSLDEADLSDLGVVRNVSDHVASLVEMSMTEGLRSFVCSAHEIRGLKARFPEVYLVTPGLHIDDTSRAADQKRGMHYRQALDEGADLLVIGRAIWNSPRPEEAVLRVMGDL